ncbi:hypothetical protein, partial [Vibrio nomapromontoriensis]|uniref:hypothetical protein n=1 Tax=Vibrio nomapromontoriensis TaxID=2910246 RepID=UPI003D0DAFB4
MTLIQRQFIRLEEISNKTHLTKWDVLGAIEEGNLQLCAWVDETNFGALFRLDGQRVVAAVFDYVGVVKLTPQDSKRFAITLKKHSTNVCAVLQPSNIRNWRSVPQVFGKPDVLNIHYSETMPPKAKQGTAAYTKLAVVPNFASSVHKFCELYADNFPSESQSTSVQKLLDKHPVNKSYLKSYPIQIQPEHLRLNLDDIAKVFGHDSIRAFNAPTKQEQVTQCNSNALAQPLGNAQGSTVTHYVNPNVSASTVTNNRLDSVK